MRLIVFIASFISLSFIGYSQSQVGFYGMFSKSSIHNSSNLNAGPIYQPLTSFSQGGGAYYVYKFTDKRFGNRRLHGRMLSSFVNSWSLRLGGMAQSHTQKWKSEFYEPNYGWKYKEIIGKKRLRYAKFIAYVQHSYPLVHLKKWNAYWYGGFNGSYLFKADGGILTWELSGAEIDGIPLVDYYDLPPYDKQYFKTFVWEAAGGIGVTYMASTFLQVNFGLHSDWSISTVENNDITLWPLISDNALDDVGVYDRNSTRGNSRLSNLATEIGVEYTFHKGEHARAKF